MTDEPLPALWALDEAARRTNGHDWRTIIGGFPCIYQQAIIAHARTIERLEPAPGHPIEELWYDAYSAWTEAGDQEGHLAAVAVLRAYIEGLGK